MYAIFPLFVKVGLNNAHNRVTLWFWFCLMTSRGATAMPIYSLHAKH